MDDLENEPDKPRTFKKGYPSGGCTRRFLEANTKSRERRYYRSFCQKMFANQDALSMKTAKGFLDRDHLS